MAASPASPRAALPLQSLCAVRHLWRILGADELPENCVVPPHFATPIKLLGRLDVLWVLGLCLNISSFGQESGMFCLLMRRIPSLGAGTPWVSTRQSQPTP